MLRWMFGEPPHQRQGTMQETAEAAARFILLMQEKGEGESREAVKYRKYAIWSEGLLRSLDEIEQSRYAAKRFAERLKKPSIEEMSPDERLDYYRHVYFDKNAYIRLFALLDKLGVLLNEMLGLQTERLKPHFSFFTVLRSLRKSEDHRELADALAEKKDRHQDALNRLRRRRNMEIHHMNAELQDDLLHTLQPDAGAACLEDIRANMSDLEEGWEIAVQSLLQSFRYLRKAARGPA